RTCKHLHRYLPNLERALNTADSIWPKSGFSVFSRITEHGSRITQLHYTGTSSLASFMEESVTSGDTFDLIVIGCGPAGEKGGAQAAYFGKRVAVIERAEHMGGSCINTGTVPSKTLRESALYFSGLKQRGLYGIDYSLKENLTVHDFMHHEREVVDME